jgi:hypothetical protein
LDQVVIPGEAQARTAWRVSGAARVRPARPTSGAASEATPPRGKPCRRGGAAHVPTYAHSRPHTHMQRKYTHTKLVSSTS